MSNMSKIEIKVLVKQPEAPRKIKPQYSHSSVLSKVEDYIRDINSNLVDSYHQWQYLKRIYSVLVKKSKLNDEEQAIMECLAPEIEKHAQYDSTDAVDVDGVNMHKYMQD